MLIFLFGTNVYSQTRFSVPTTGWNGHNVVEFDTCFMAINRGSLSYYQSTLVFNKLSKIGDSLSTWKFQLDSNYSSHSYSQKSFVSLNGSNYASGRARDTNTNDIKGVLTKFDKNYTIRLNFSNYSFGAYTSIDHIITNKPCLIATAQVFQSNSKRFATFMKIDTNGNIVWRKDFKDNRYLWNFGLEDIFPTPDNGYLLKGWSVLNHLHYYQSIDSIINYIIKVDSNGNEEWRLRVGNNKTANSISNVVPTSDNNYLVAWTDNSLNGLTHPFYELDPNDSNSLYIAKVSPTGAVLWEKDLKNFLKITDTAIGRLYSTGYKYQIWQMKRLKDGNIAVIGDMVGQGFMLKLTEEGEPIWYRKYYPSQLPQLSDSNVTNNYVTGMIETSDNGFLLTGFNRYSQGVIPPWGLQTSYLYKVDGYGCLTEGCYKQDKWYTDSVQIAEDSVQAINDSIADAINKGEIIQLYPNPTNGQLTIKLPASYSFKSSISLSLYSSTGKLIQLTELNDYTTEIDLSNLPKGIYIAKFEGEEFYESKKVVLQ